jgi:hypothetical protein
MYLPNGILSIVAHRAVDCVEELAIFIRGVALPMHNFPASSLQSENQSTWFLPGQFFSCVGEATR